MSFDVYRMHDCTNCFEQIQIFNVNVLAKLGYPVKRNRRGENSNPARAQNKHRDGNYRRSSKAERKGKKKGGARVSRKWRERERESFMRRLECDA